MPLRGGAILLLALLVASPALGQSVAGYSEYYIPGPEGLRTGTSTQLGMWYVLDDLDDAEAGGDLTMHSVIAVTAWSPNTTVYYEHWEDGDGLNFDPDNPSTADETVLLAATGDIHVFESADIPTDGTAGTAYGGGDRIYVAGGTVTVTRSAWIEGVGAGNQAASWEIYPVKPQLTTYVLPFGENLGGGNFTPFNRVYVLVQATSDNTTFQVDFDANGTWDAIDTDRDGTTDTTTITLDAGETFLLDRVSRGPAATLDTGTVIQGSATLQVKFVVGNPGQTYCARGLSAFPRGFWTTDYYAPLDHTTGGGSGETDYYLHNPHSSAITVSWQSRTASGSFSIPANTTVSYRAAVGNVPVDSGLYFSGTDTFWGVGINDSLGATYEWGYSLLPSTFLYAEHFLGWAPGYAWWDGGGPFNYDDVGVFLTVAQDNTTVFVDHDNDGVADQTFTLDRLETQYIYDAADGDLSQTHIWATGDFTMAYGENGDTAGTSVPSMDLGYVAIPGTDFISLVLAVDKSVSPQVVPTTSGSTAVFTLVTRSEKYPVDAVGTVDMLPPDWEYVADSTTITRPDLTQITGASANPGITGSGTPADPYVLTWSAAQLDPSGMDTNQEFVVSFTAQTTSALASGTLSRNRVESTGTRTLGSPSATQTFTTTDFAFVTSGALVIGKTSAAVEPLYPGDQFTYTVVVSNPAGGITQTGVSLYDAIPAGTSYAAGSGQVTCEFPFNVRDEFGTVSYANNDGSQNWAAAWSETDTRGGGASSGAVRVAGDALRLTYVDALGYVRDEFNTNGSGTGNDGSVNWASNWTETGDDGSFASGDILVTGNQIQFNGGAAADDSFQRDVTITSATSATVSFYFEDSDTTIAGYDDAVVEYSIDGSGYTTLFTMDANSAHGYYTSTFAVSGDLLTLRFRLADDIEGADQNRFDDIQVDLRDFVLDQFDTAGSATGNDGTVNWSTDWTESDSGNPGINFNSGNIEIEQGRLELQNATNAGDYAERSVDVTGFTGNATLSFDWDNNGLAGDGSDNILVQYSLDGGGFTTLLTQNGADADGSYSASIPVSGNSTLTIRIVAEDDLENPPGPGSAEEARFDNVRVTYPSGTAGGPAANDRAARTANLTGATSAILTLSSATSGTLDDTDVVEVWIDDDATFDGDSVLLESVINDNAFTGSYDITPYVSANTTVFFVVNGGIDAAGEWRSFDDVDITYWVASTFASGAPPGFLSASSGCGIRPGGTVTLTFDVTVDDPFPTGQDSITNTGATTTNELPVQLTASVTNIVVVPSSGSATVGDRVWLDRDGDGELDPGETGLSGVEVTLKDEFGTPLQVATTDGLGRYLFVDVEPGNGYYVEITDGLLPGLTQTTDGRTDLRTNAFDLSDGQAYDQADLGFRPSPGTAAIGDTVWVDANSNQVRDSGEVGLPGITVQLYEDTNGDGIPDGAPIATQVTGPGGLYLFTNVPANGILDYVVTLDTGQAGLSGYTATTLTSFSYLNIPSGDSRVDADFGFVGGAGTTYTILDGIWLDDGTGAGTASDGVRNGGEVGIGGVTVSLLDSGGNTIATTITSASGNFAFSGVPAGYNYSWRVTDDDHVLADLYGTSSYALAGEFQMTGTLASNLDYTATPHFGYNATRAIGDAVWNDIDGSGTQNAGEPGIGGVTVLLFADDGDGVFEPGGDDGASIASLVTTATGFYLFSGLANGPYWVSVDETQPALSGYNVLTTADNSGVAGHQRLVTLSGSGNQLGIDYGYQASTSYSISGRLWNDADDEGDDADGEPGFSGVTLELLQGGLVVAATTTGANGTYSFAGLPAGSYTVRVTDTGGVLTGFSTTYEQTEGALAGSYDGEEDVTIGPNVTGLSFGYYNPFREPTLAIVSSFAAHDESGAVVIEWETAAEVGTVGFDLYRFDEEERQYVQVNDGLLTALIGNPQGGTYRYVDDQARPATSYWYALVEVEASGRLIPMGPYRVNTDFAVEADRSDQRRAALGAGPTHRFAKSPRWALSPQRPAGVRASAWNRATARKARITQSRPALAKIAVADTGIYYVPRAALAEGGGPGGRGWLRLALTNQGRKVAFAPSADRQGIYFYGQALDSPFARDNVYWFGESKGKPRKMPRRRDRRARPSGVETFTRSVHAEDDLLPVLSLFSDPEGDWSLWDYTFGGWAAKPFVFRADGATGSGAAALTLHLKGGSDTVTDPDHHVVVRLNGDYVGEVSFDGTEASATTFPLDAASLLDGENTLEVQALTDTGAPYSLVYIDSFDVEYQSAYRARDNRLSCSTGDNGSILISGFSRDDVMVFDVTDAKWPVVIRTPVLTLSDGSYGVALSAPGPDTRYYALTPDALQSGEVVVDRPSTLRKRRNAGEYLVITTGEMLETAQTLADYRGMSSMVVDLEDVYDEFGFGIRTPHALRDFLAHAWSRWRTPPRYVVLAGDGTYDYKDVLGQGGNLIPPMMVTTPDGLAPSDIWFADLDPTGPAPEVAIGRLPVSTPAQLLAVIQKIEAREGLGGDWLSRLVLAADNPDPAGAFPTDSERIAALAPPEVALQRIYLSSLPPATARAQLIAAIDEGAGMVSYIGHAGYSVLADEQLLRSEDVSHLTNPDRPTVLTAATCLAGDFAMPYIQAIGEMLVQATGGGAAAVWAPTGLSEDEHAVALMEAYYSAVFAGGEVRIGDAIVAAMKEYEQTWRPGYLLPLYGLLGDPAMPIGR